ncbi:MAG: amidohydrolase family protein [Acidimicrobiia bacterium]
MIGTTLVVDAVVHPYDLGPQNRTPDGLDQLRALHPFHVLCSGSEPSDYVLEADEFLVDFDPEAVAHAVFAESPVDMAIIHSLPNLGFTKGVVTDPERMARLRERHPGRFLLYASVDTPVTDAAVEQLRRQVELLGVDGLKLYPSFFYDGGAQGWRLDDDDFATPLLEAAFDLGIRNVAVHKAIPVSPAPEECFRVDDLAGALERFGDINFQVVHAGVAFLPETARLLATHPNVYANLESTFSYILSKPRRFAQMLGTLLAAGGPGRLLFGSGCNLTHPRPLLDAFGAFDMPDDLVAEHGYPALTDEARRLILGGNALRIHGLHATEVAARTAEDPFAVKRAGGLARPWALVRGPS